MGATFLKAKGEPVGDTTVEDVLEARHLLEAIEARGKTVVFPVDHVVIPSRYDSKQKPRTVFRIEKGYRVVDVGPQTVTRFGEYIEKAQTIFCNGPMGWFEKSPFAVGTKDVLQLVAQSSATTVVGGGETATVASEMGLQKKITHVSTGGGASLMYLQGTSLPGLEALKSQERSL